MGRGRREQHLQDGGGGGGQRQWESQPKGMVELASPTGNEGSSQGAFKGVCQMHLRTYLWDKTSVLGDSVRVTP